MVLSTSPLLAVRVEQRRYSDILYILYILYISDILYILSVSLVRIEVGKEGRGASRPQGSLLLLVALRLLSLCV